MAFVGSVLRQPWQHPLPVSGDDYSNYLALDLDFISKHTLDNNITFTRASSATYVNSAGLIATALTNNPRFDYDPVTLAALGLLIEEQRTNLLLNSPVDGTGLLTQSVTVAATPYTLSFYGTGTITLSGTSTSGPLVGTGVYPNRVTLTFTPTAGSLTLTVSGSVRWAQLEAGSFATSHIPTAGSQATRVADDAQITGASFSAFYNQAEGVLFADYDLIGMPGGMHVAAILFDGANYHRILPYSGGMNGKTNLANVAQADVIQAQPSLNARHKTAYGYQLDNFALVTDGGTVGTDGSGTATVAANRLLLGASGSVVGVGYLNGHIRSVRYYRSRLANDAMRSLTA